MLFGAPEAPLHELSSKPWLASIRGASSPFQASDISGQICFWIAWILRGFSWLLFRLQPYSYSTLALQSTLAVVHAQAEGSSLVVVGFPAVRIFLEDGCWQTPSGSLRSPLLQAVVMFVASHDYFLSTLWRHTSGGECMWDLWEAFWRIDAS